MKPRDAEESFQKLKEDLKKGQLRQMYLLFGEERYLTHLYAGKLLTAMGGDKNDMNTNVYDGKNINVGALIDQAETLPFLAERRVIYVTDSGLFKSGGEQLAKYLEEACESTSFIFYETEVDGKSKLYKTVQSKGLVTEIGPQSKQSQLGYINAYLKRDNKMISMPAAERILQKTGSNLNSVFCELEKLICYAMDRPEITLEDVDAVCSETLEDRIFDMIEAVVRKDASKALKLYYDLLALKEAPIKILALIERHYNILLQIRDMREEGETREVIGEKMSLFNSYVLNNYMNQASKYTSEYLKEALRECVKTDEEIKTGKISDILGVETLILSRIS